METYNVWEVKGMVKKNFKRIIVGLILASVLLAVIPIMTASAIVEEEAPQCPQCGYMWFYVISRYGVTVGGTTYCEVTYN